MQSVKRSAVITPTTVVVVLGNGTEEIYRSRANHAISVHRTLSSFLSALDQNSKVLLLAKFYTENFKISYFREKMGDLSGKLVSDELSKVYRLALNTFDTITEAVGCRCLIEKMFSVNLVENPNFRLHLVIVSSEFHIGRVQWIFDNVFSDVAWISVSFDASPQTPIEEGRDEQDLINRQKIAVSEHGSIADFVNHKREEGDSRYKFEFRIRTVEEAIIFRSKYQIYHFP